MFDPELAALRTNYDTPGIDVGDLDPDPVEQFRRWFHEAMAAGVEEPHAMTLATAGRDGRPSARTVLLKGYDREGFVFFTNYESRKAVQLEENPRAALVFLWSKVHRQVRVEGNVIRTSPEVSDAYFASRPLGARLSAIASPQSRVVPSREWLEARVEELRRAGDDPPRPHYWGGYVVRPVEFEFWQGRADRLHDRFRYRRQETGWVIERLAP
jgi:pyridoxamine 5'-phosphate oxidase